MKNKARARDKAKKGPAPVVDGCPGCGLAFHSKYERKRHRCSPKARARAASKPAPAVCSLCDRRADDARIRSCTNRDCPMAHRRAA